MAHASYMTSARAMALGAAPLAWFCAATWPTFSPPLTLDDVLNKPRERLEIEDEPERDREIENEREIDREIDRDPGLSH
jgi:hypothetical protein